MLQAMANHSLRALAFTLALASVSALTGCHARWNPLGSAPAYYFRTKAADATLGKPAEGVVTDEDDGYAYGFKYTIPAPGSLLLTAKPANAATQLDISVYTDGSEPVATTTGNSDKKLQVQDVQPGDLFVVVKEAWKEAVRSKFKLTVVFKPTDPDAANGVYKTKPGARELPADHGNLGDAVDYSAMRRTNWWRVTTQGEGDFTLKFLKADDASKLTAEWVPDTGAPEKIDPVVGLNKKDLPPGDYYVKVTADDAGDSGKYTLQTTWKGGDTCKNGGPACFVDGAEDLKLPGDTRQGDVDFTKGKQFHFYKLSVKEKGKLNISFKVLAPPRGSKVSCYFMRKADDDGEKITGSGSSTKVLDPGDYFVRVVAPDQGDVGKYALVTLWQPDNFILGDVVEKSVTPTCMLTVSVGSNQGVRAGVGATIVGPGNLPIDSGVVDSAFSNLSKVRPFGSCTRIPANGTKVQIQAQ
jgi:hypothetical protein